MTSLTEIKKIIEMNWGAVHEVMSASALDSHRAVETVEFDDFNVELYEIDQDGEVTVNGFYVTDSEDSEYIATFKSC
ncbi:MAG: hypothetical protein ACRDAS_00920 [Cetobacterium sp.]